MDPNGLAVATESVAQDGGATAVEPAAPTTQGTVDWENESNPYKARYTGLQGNFKQRERELQEYQRQVEASGELIATLQGQAQGLTPEQITQTIQAQKQRQQMESVFQGLMAERQMTNEAAKPIALAKIAQQYGVDVADLEDAPSPEAAEYTARKMATKGRTNNLQARKQGGVDAAESGGGGGPNWDSLSASEKIRRGVELEIRRSRSG